MLGLFICIFTEVGRVDYKSLDLKVTGTMFFRGVRHSQAPSVIVLWPFKELPEYRLYSTLLLGGGIKIYVWIHSMAIENFRGISSQNIGFDENLTILIGSNGSGKTTIIDAIDIFFNSKKVEDDDYHNDTDEPIKITIKFGGSLPIITKQFPNQCGITKEIPRNKDSELYINIPIYSRFKDVIGMNPNDMKKKYQELRNNEFPDLPKLDTSKEIKHTLLRYGIKNTNEPETTAKENITRQDLKGIESFVIEARRDPARDRNEYKKSTLTMLVNSIILKSKSESISLELLNNNIKALYDNHINNRSVTLQNMSDSISQMLKGIELDMGIELSWEPVTDINILKPNARARINEHGHTSNVDKAGQGAQRLFLYAILRYYHENKESDILDPNQVIVIDEPELHQHPIRQDAFYSVLKMLAGKLQVIYSTHSDKFVSVEDLPRLRFFEKSDGIVTINKTNFERIASLAKGIVRNPTPEQMKKNLSVVDTPDFRASLFSKMAVLVEGISDRAIIKSVARIMNKDFAALGISMVVCDGKNNIREQLLFYKDLKIPAYVIWDLDQKDSNMDHVSNKNKKDFNDKKNRKIFKYMGIKPPDIIKMEITESYSCLCGNMNDLVNSIDEKIVEKYKKDIADSLNFSYFNEKSDYMMQKLIDKIYETYSLDKIEEIIKKIIEMLYANTSK